jgi:hypothetical protein
MMRSIPRTPKFHLVLLLLAALCAQSGCSTAPVSSDEDTSPSAGRSPTPIDGTYSRKQRIQIFTAIEGL